MNELTDGCKLRDCRRELAAYVEYEAAAFTRLRSRRCYRQYYNDVHIRHNGTSSHARRVLVALYSPHMRFG